MYMLTESSEDGSGLAVEFFGLVYYCHLSSCVRFVYSGDDCINNLALVIPGFVCF